MIGRERCQNVLGVKNRAGRVGTGITELALNQALGPLATEGRRKGVDIAPFCDDTAALSTTHPHHFDDETLRRTSGGIRGLRGGGCRIANVAECDTAEIGVKLSRLHVSRDQNDLGKWYFDHKLTVERIAEVPMLLDRRQRHGGKLSPCDYHAPCCVSFAGDPRAARRMPAVQTDHDLDRV